MFYFISSENDMDLRNVHQSISVQLHSHLYGHLCLCSPARAAAGGGGASCEGNEEIRYGGEKKNQTHLEVRYLYLLLRHLHLIASPAPTSVVNLFAFKIIIYCFATPKQLFSYLVTNLA